jgi:hypothetical protein
MVPFLIIILNVHRVGSGCVRKNKSGAYGARTRNLRRDRAAL